MNIIYLSTILYLVGCYLGLEKFLWSDGRIAILFMLLVIIGLCFFFRRFFKIFVAFVTAFFFLLGLWFGSGANYVKLELADCFKQNVKVFGQIDPMSVRENEYSNSCTVDCLKFFVENEEINFKGKLRISTQNKIPERGILKIEGKLLELNSYRNPGVFDMEVWNRVQNFGGRIKKAKVQNVTEQFINDLNFFQNIKDNLAIFNLRLRKTITEIVPDEAGSIINGMLLGGSVGLSDETREIFSANGLSHLLSVSGTHLMLLAGFLLAALKPLEKIYIKKKIVINNPKAQENNNFNLRNIFVVAVLFFYALFCGLRPPVLRAFLMTMAVLFGGKGLARGNVLCMVGIILLIFNPVWLLDVGFQLSFGAVAGLIWLFPVLQKFFKKYLWQIIADLLSVTFAAQLATLPFLVGYFHQISLLSLPASLIFLPLLELGTLLSLIGVMFSFLFNFTLPLQIAGVIVTQVLQWADFLAQIPWSVIIISSQPLWCGLIYYLFLILIFNLKCVQWLKFQYKKILVGVCCIFLSIKFLSAYFVPNNMTIYFLDVGQGDCTVVVTPQKEVLIVDTGGSFGFDLGSRVLVPFLRNIGINKIDVLLLSHGDFDHAGGAAGLVRNIPIQKIIFQQGELSEYEKELLALANDSEINFAKSGDQYIFSEASLNILDAPTENKKNDTSVVASFEFNGYGILFTGDIDEARENNLQLTKTYNIVKVPHHGSKYSNSEEFYAMVKPEVAIISVGKDNGYGHPHKDAMERISASGAKIFRTDEMGMIKIEFDDYGYRCEKFVE